MTGKNNTKKPLQTLNFSTSNTNYLFEDFNRNHIFKIINLSNPLSSKPKIVAHLNENQQGMKQLLRKKIGAERKSLSEATFFDYSKKICDTFLQSNEFKEANIIHCYVSMNARKEVDTISLLQKIIDSGKTVIVPVMLTDGLLEHVQLNNLDVLKENAWGILEPVQGIKLNPDTADCIIVPMLAGDIHGNRLGYGKGYYDRFLSGSNAIKIGFCFDFAILDTLPTEQHDEKLSYIITEKRILSARYP